jgi:hypothetical protein
MKHIFIASSPKDHKEMQVLTRYLQLAGFRPWVDPAPRPGQDWRPEIDKAIDAADAIVVMVTPAAAASLFVTYEWARALGSGKPIIPVIIKDTPMHPALSKQPTIFKASAFTKLTDFWEYFIKEMRLMFPASYQPSSGPAHETLAELKTNPPVAVPVPGNDFNQNVMPTMPGHWLVIRRGPHMNTSFRLDKNMLTIGRDAANDITINDPEVSRFHVRILWHDNQYFVEDMGSTNGTVVEGQRINGLQAIPRGAKLMLGDNIILSYEVVS